MAADEEKKVAIDHRGHGHASSNESLSGITGDVRDEHALAALGYKPQLQRNRSILTLLFQSLAIAAIPYGEGAPLLTAIYGGGQLSIFLGWIVVVLLDGCIGVSLAEIASKYPTSSGVYYWSYQLSGGSTLLSFITGWVWAIGNVTITLSVNFGFASLVGATIQVARPDVTITPWQLLLIFYALLLITMSICVFCNKILPLVDTICAAFTAISIIIIMVAVSSVAAGGRHSPSDTLGNYDPTLSGWSSFSFLIGLLPAAYTFSAIGMITSMSEEVRDPTIKMPWAISLCVPVGGLAGLFFLIPLCATLAPLGDIIANAGLAQALPYILYTATGTAAGCIGLVTLVLVVTLFCSISITTACARALWAFARVHARLGVPVYAIALVTLIQALLGLINLGSAAAFTGFTSAGVIALAVGYGIPIGISLRNGRAQVQSARWNAGRVGGTLANVVSVAWIAFELVLFSMPTTLPVTAMTMNWAIVIVVGFMGVSAVYYVVHARHVFKGPPASDGIEE